MRQAIFIVLVGLLLVGCAHNQERSERITSAAVTAATPTPNFDIGNSAYSGGGWGGSLLFFGGWCLGELVGSMFEDEEESSVSSSKEKDIYEILEDIKQKESSGHD